MDVYKRLVNLCSHRQQYAVGLGLDEATALHIGTVTCDAKGVHAIPFKHPERAASFGLFVDAESHLLANC